MFQSGFAPIFHINYEWLTYAIPDNHQAHIVELLSKSVALFIDFSCHNNLLNMEIHSASPIGKTILNNYSTVLIRSINVIVHIASVIALNM